MAIENEFMHYIQIQPSGGFAVSKKYLIDIPNRQIINKKNNKRLPYDIKSKILVYEDRQKTWFFDIADNLKKNNEAGFVILMIGVSYLESNQKYRNGITTQSSTKRIKTALTRIFNNQITPKAINVFVDGVRNGLFHDGITKKGVFINASQVDVFSFDAIQKTLIVNPHKFLEATKHDFKDYIKILKNKRNIPERTNFEMMWDSLKGI